MLRNQRLLKYFVLLAANFFTGLVAAEQCTAIFPGGIQSHSPSGVIQMGYMSRVFGSGPMLTAPTVTHTHSWQDQVGLCDGVKCTASGTHASTQNVEFLTGTEVPAVFELSASNNNVSNGYQAGALALPVADYGTVSVGQESTVRFTTVDSIYRTKTIKTNYKSVIEFQPGTYWVNGNLDWTAQGTRIRRLNGSNGRVTLYVSGNVNISQLHFEGFSEGQIRIYAKGSVTAGNDFIFPGEIHAGGRVGFGERAKITGGIYSGNFSTGNGAVVRYTRQNHDHKMGALNPAYNSTFELTPGNYWIDGGFDASVASKFRKVGGSGVVRLFVRGNVNVQHGASFEGFAGGDLVMYSTGKITLTSQTDLPAFVYAVGDVEINFSQGASYRGGITGRNVYIGQNSIVQYLDPVDLGPLCESGGGPGPIDPDDPIECGVVLEVGPMIAGKPHFATVTALDEPLSCETPSVLNVLFDYEDRGLNHESVSIWVNGEEIKEGKSKRFPDIEWVGKETRLDIEYEEAGELYLALLDAKEQVVTGGDEVFVSRPYGFCIKLPLLQEAPILEDGAVDFDSLVRFKAGESIPVSVTAVRWKENGEVYGSLDEPLAAENICDNGATVNYRQSDPTNFLEIPELILPLPALGVPGVASGSFKHDPNDPALNGSVNADVTLSEVGFFRITMKEPPAYLGATMSHSISQSAIIGRIIPAWLELGEKPSQNIGCPLPPSETTEGRSFTYQGQPTFLTDKLEIWGFNRSGDRTQNYKGDFWRFSGTLEGSKKDGAEVYELHQDSATPMAGQPSAIAERVSPMPVFTAKPENAAFLPSGGYSYTRPATPSALDNPFRLNMVIWNWHDRDGVYFKRDDDQPEDERGFKPTVPIPVVALIGDSDFRLGRIRSENLIVPHGNSAQAPIVLEHWKGTAWQQDIDNDCTLLAPPTDSTERVSFPDSGLPDARVDEAEEWNQSYLQITDATGREPKPKSEPQGRVLLHHLLQHSNGASATWLCQQRSEDSAPLGGVCSYQEGGDAETRSSITFGIYQGPKPLIFRRELYRGMQ